MAARLYDTTRWRVAARRFLSDRPLCVYCGRMGRTRAATVVDHVTPHKGDRSLFWDRANWQPLCKPCHDSVKAREERGGNLIGCDVSGIPLDPAHHWNRGEQGRAGERSRATPSTTELGLARVRSRN
jgi:hypothetical protein